MSILHRDLEWICKAKRKRYKQIKKQSICYGNIVMFNQNSAYG